ncbi:MAG: hypothetical protein MUC64_09650 [Rubritepida sp.]|nr:hypothetical protein [Rubritepida sp.]
MRASAELRGAVGYVFIAFALGFLLGPLRAFVLAPVVGDLAALLIELPIMLGFCWWLAPRVARGVAPGAPRLRLGAAALVLLLVLEFGVGAWLRGWNLREWLGLFATTGGAVSLCGYVVFALIPWLRGYRHP